MKLLIIGDPHFKITNVRETDEMTDQIILSAKNITPNAIIVLGDILDRHETIHISPYIRSLNLLKELMEIAPTYVLIGNHDLKNNTEFLSNEHAFGPIKYWDSSKINIIDTTKEILIDNFKFVMVPYVPPGRFVEALNLCPEWMLADCIFAHQEFKGCKMGAITSVSGDNWPLDYPYVVSGHIHDYQTPQKNILYTGTPIQHGFGDTKDKSISLLTFTSGTKGFSEDRIYLNVRKKVIKYLTAQDLNNAKFDPTMDYKIVIKGSEQEIKAIKKYPIILSWQQKGYKVTFKINRIKQEKTSVPLKSDEYKNFLQILYEKIQDSPELKSVYIKVFSTNS